MRQPPATTCSSPSTTRPPPATAPRSRARASTTTPRPGPAGEKFVYGHIWVTLAWLARHPAWDTLALPLRALLYVRAKDVPKLAKRYSVDVSHQAGIGRRIGALAVRLVGRHGQATACGRRWRLRQASLPPAGAGLGRGRVQPPAQGCQPAHAAADDTPARFAGAAAELRQGADRLGQACRAASAVGGGWRAVQYGERVVKTIKTFVATWRPAGGRIRVVMVREKRGWLAYFCTDAGR